MSVDKDLDTWLEDTLTKSLGGLYQPEITNLEMNEHQGLSKPVIYLDQAINTATQSLKADLIKWAEELVRLGKIEVIERILEAGDGKSWDTQMAGAVGEVAKIHTELIKEIK